MLQSQFILQNAHFALSLLGAFVFFAAAWLYFDAWLGRKALKDACKVLGFLLISLSFMVHATHVEESLLVNSLFNESFMATLFSILRIGGYFLLIVGMILDPLQERPHHTKAGVAAGMVLPAQYLTNLPTLVLSPLAALVGFLFLRRGTIGLENHLKPVALSFYLLALSELLSIGEAFQNTNNIQLSNFVAPFGPLWIIEHLILLVSILILRQWVFKYLLKRIQTQLFMIFTTATMVIFLVTTISFTFLLLKNLENDALAHLRTDVSVLQYAIDSKKAETLSDAQVVAQNPQIQQAITNGDRKSLRDLTQTSLLAKKQTFLDIASASGEVLMRGEDPSKIGDSISDDPLVKRALSGQDASSVISKDGVLAPSLSVRSVSPIKSGEDIIGVVIVGTTIDNAFVDGVKAATKLDAAVYAGNIRSATTLVAADGKSRYIGIKEETASVKKTVLQDGNVFTGSVNVLNTPYFAAYAPILDVDQTPVGMLFVGTQQVTILQTASKSIELTFVVAVALILLSIVPAFLIARYIAAQLE